jgi:DNA-binding transcriptional MerR regulator
MDALLDTHEVAEWLGVAPQTLRYWRGEGRGPRWIKVGQRIRYRPSDVELWLRAREHGPTELEVAL